MAIANNHIYCDNPNCKMYVTSCIRFKRICNLIKYAENLGWHRLFDHDICPKCWKESGRE
jgi:hypothetical protein